VSRFIVEENRRDSFCEQLVDRLARFSFERTFDQKYDFFAAVFEYLISDYNKDSGTYGEYFTPHSIATIMARIIVPEGDTNVTVYDPAAGTGTLVLAVPHTR
jgi:type I restriction enzyme M protein